MENVNNDFEELFNDLVHPNPNINYQAFEKLRRLWPDKSIQRLILNLDSKDIYLRRKCVKGVAFFGREIVDIIINLYFSSNNQTQQLSCLKVLAIVAFKNNIYQEKINTLIESALANESPEMILASISLLRQIGENSLPYLKLLCRDKNILKAKAAITALVEIDHSSLQLFLLELSQDNQVDTLIRDNAKDMLDS